ncbi:MAG: 3-dehydroquinate dehydratase [Polyangiaceae bacterium]|nr:3-dehydroquinate dehydratase [Polyangiaceae bacterium]MCW5791905.1 3-dehydroquinate dehydratase [Polyangiaceae bacterium]
MDEAGAAGAGPVRLLVLNGPNLDRLGRREPEIYGHQTLADLERALAAEAATLGAAIVCRQSNHEGDLVGWVGAAEDEGFHAILLNAGALTHTSYSLYDALRGSSLPCVEVHLSNPEAREPFRHQSVIAAACVGKVSGFGVASYALAARGALAVLAKAASD